MAWLVVDSKLEHKSWKKNERFTLFFYPGSSACFILSLNSQASVLMAGC